MYREKYINDVDLCVYRVSKRRESLVDDSAGRGEGDHPLTLDRSYCIELLCLCIAIAMYKRMKAESRFVHVLV